MLQPFRHRYLTWRPVNDIHRLLIWLYPFSTDHSHTFANRSRFYGRRSLPRVGPCGFVTANLAFNVSHPAFQLSFLQYLTGIFVHRPTARVLANGLSSGKLT